MHKYLGTESMSSHMPSEYLKHGHGSRDINIDRLDNESTTTEMRRDGSLYSTGTDIVRLGSIASRNEPLAQKMSGGSEDPQTFSFDRQLSAFEKARTSNLSQQEESENKIFEEMERAVMMEREKILKETDDKLALIENAGRD